MPEVRQRGPGEGSLHGPKQEIWLLFTFGWRLCLILAVVESLLPRSRANRNGLMS
jgi:hypothetical protein